MDIKAGGDVYRQSTGKPGGGWIRMSPASQAMDYATKREARLLDKLADLNNRIAQLSEFIGGVIG